MLSPDGMEHAPHPATVGLSRFFADQRRRVRTRLRDSMIRVTTARAVAQREADAEWDIRKALGVTLGTSLSMTTPDD